ncbi:hypothetical protein AVEN_262605-1 [Araneus ventricosus]|uniref:Uncharacterized protein n=1 Tax=Araneus ventricosus TaxID=182803 RepID=A0A4Y2TPF3_ARAVE|nr:hypothetical protein AVEN_262605-1 [Araneus ventricosus]
MKFVILFTRIVGGKAATFPLQRHLPYPDVKKFISHQVHSLWQKSRDQQVQNRLHVIHPLICLWPHVPTRELDVKLSRLRIGRTRFTHIHLLLGESYPTCVTCHTDFTVAHILAECLVFNNHRFCFPGLSSVNIGGLIGEYLIKSIHCGKSLGINRYKTDFMSSIL